MKFSLFGELSHFGWGRLTWLQDLNNLSVQTFLCLEVTKDTLMAADMSKLMSCLVFYIFAVFDLVDQSVL